MTDSVIFENKRYEVKVGPASLDEKIAGQPRFLVIDKKYNFVVAETTVQAQAQFYARDFYDALLNFSDTHNQILQAKPEIQLDS